MKISDWITVIGWFVSFIIGVISVLITQYISKKKQVIAWSIVGESNIISNESFGGFGVPIKISVNGIEEDDISSVRVRIGNRGNVEIKNIRLIFRFGEEAKLLSGELAKNLGLYAECIHINNQGTSATVDIDYINPRYFFDMDFLVGKYKISSVYVDMAKAGVELIKTEFTRWDLEFTRDILNTFSLSLLGLQFSRRTYYLAEIADELSKIREIVDKYNKNVK